MSTSPVQIPKGTDMTINMTVYAANGTTPLNLNSYPYMDIYLYQTGSKTIIEQYSVVSAANYENIFYTDAAAGQISFVITKNATRKSKEGDVFVCIRVSDGTYYYGASHIQVGTIQDSVGGGNTIPT